MTIKLIATDMDGTFLDDDKQYDRRYFAQLYRDMQTRNIQFVVASGNQYYQLKSFFEDYPEVIYLAENGAYLRTADQVLDYSNFTQAQFEQIMDKLCAIPELDLIIAGKKSAYLLPETPQSFTDISRLYYKHLDFIDDYHTLDDKIFKIGIHCPDERTEEFVQRLKIELDGLGTPTSSGHGDIDIIQPGIHKANGLKKLGELLNIDLQEMVAFGDGGNDLEMLTEVGLGVAMANAPEPIQNAADVLTTTNNKQGVLTYIDQLIHQES
ncbi:Cof-type HAD-IIB family hydrolase [Lapidilactobacillus mulanensis]|uniref:Cof-type HAD-IIB family hydrolase n=1 Tax=Lapidilactobacillus mulanensis TaxID=2485999 RepID=A0ABW4DN11_9LACO|nr:Cof-type HAD-IIB family hydrolase [Lapidilactobacillus mulanensis]